MGDAKCRQETREEATAVVQEKSGAGLAQSLYPGDVWEVEGRGEWSKAIPKLA